MARCHYDGFGGWGHGLTLCRIFKHYRFLMILECKKDKILVFRGEIQRLHAADVRPCDVLFALN
jgi:hypothetical protein